MNNELMNFGKRPPAQAPPQRGFCPGGRALWLGEISDFGTSTPHSLPSEADPLRRTGAFPARPAGGRNPQSGISLIEVILVLVIIAILAAVVIPRAGFDISSTASLDGAAYMIASDIRYVQECAMANGVSKSIAFVSGASTYTFPATVPSTSNLDPSGRLPSGVTIGTTVTFTFNSFGEPTTSAGWTVTVPGSTKTITVTNYTGKVSY